MIPDSRATSTDLGDGGAHTSEAYLKLRQLLSKKAGEDEVLKFAKDYLQPLNIVECEFFVLDLIRSSRESQLRFEFGSRIADIPSMRDLEFLKKKILDNHNSNPDGLSQVINGFERSAKHFEQIVSAEISEVTKQASGAFYKAWQYFMETHQDRQNRHPRHLYVPDGELTFFSILWGLVTPTVQRIDGDVRGAFGLSWEGGKPKREQTSLIDFFAACGLLMRQSEQWEFSPRWKSLLAWLRTEADRIKDIDSDFYRQKLNDEAGFAKWPGKFCGKKFAEARDGLIESCVSLRELLISSSTSDSDRMWTEQEIEIFKACQAPFLPWEYFLRAWQPYPMHLLIVPAGETVESPLANQSGLQVPHTIAFASVVNDLEDNADNFLFRIKRLERFLNMLGEVWAYPALANAARENRKISADKRTFEDFWHFVKPNKWGHTAKDPLPNKQEASGGVELANEAAKQFLLEGIAEADSLDTDGVLVETAYESMKGCWAGSIDENGNSSDGYPIRLGTIAFVLAFVAKKNCWELAVPLNVSSDCSDAAYNLALAEWTDHKGSRPYDVELRKAILNALYDFFLEQQSCYNVAWQDSALVLFFPGSAGGNLTKLEKAVHARYAELCRGARSLVGLEKKKKEGTRHTSSDALARLELLAGVDLVFGQTTSSRPRRGLVLVDDVHINDKRYIRVSFVAYCEE